MSKLTYKDAGVDIDEGNRVVKDIKRLAKETYSPEVMEGIGGFGSLFSINTIKYKNPVLVSSTDGVGTKLKIAFLTDRHSTIGIDLVAMGANDIITQGAEPLFFLDYLSTSSLKDIKASEIMRGITKGCEIAGCSLIGGETAEMPGFYKQGEYDLAGFVVGIVDREKIIDGSHISIGDSIIGLASSGLHSNGFSLARKVLFEKMGYTVESRLKGIDRSLGDELLTPTRIYVKSILNIIKDFTVKGIAHITGGGLIENLPRILPKSCIAVIERRRWEMPVIFQLLKEYGNISDDELFRTFNCGIGMVVIVPEKEAEDVIQRLKGLDEEAYIIGSIEERTGIKDSIKMI